LVVRVLSCAAGICRALSSDEPGEVARVTMVRAEGPLSEIKFPHLIVGNPSAEIGRFAFVERAAGERFTARIASVSATERSYRIRRTTS